VNKLRRTRQSVAAILLLLVFSLQVQATFACELADYRGAVKDCCCHSDDPQPDMMPAEPASCCEYSQEVQVKGSDPAQENEPVIPGKSLETKPPPILFAVIATWLLEIETSSAVVLTATSDPPLSAGTRTWLAT
jgi:hypothetical protein